MNSLTTVREYVADENAHQCRTAILAQLRLRAAELRAQDAPDEVESDDPRPCL